MRTAPAVTATLPAAVLGAVLTLVLALAPALVPGGVRAHADPGPLPTGVPLREAVDRLVEAGEDREGYSRDRFRHRIDADRDGCSTRAEVLLEQDLTAAKAVIQRLVLENQRLHQALEEASKVTPLDHKRRNRRPMSEH